MRYRWDPVYPSGRRDTPAPDSALRASDEERNAVADVLSHHYADGRLDESEFKARLDAAMSATTRGDLGGLFHDLPRLPREPAPPPPRYRRALPWLFLLVFLAVVTVATVPVTPLARVPWPVVALVGFVLWRAAGGHTHRHRHRHGDDPPGSFTAP